MNKYLLTVTIPNGEKVEGMLSGESLEELQDKYERLFTFDYDEGLWVYKTFIPENVIKNSIFTIKYLYAETN